MMMNLGWERLIFPCCMVCKFLFSHSISTVRVPVSHLMLHIDVGAVVALYIRSSYGVGAALYRLKFRISYGL
jgi:hypothetical protein